MQEYGKYLFCYFTGNEPEEESVHFAVSEDGYCFHALNQNKQVIRQKLGKKCARDPFIFRDKEQIFHIIATDMRCHDGWCSNHSMVIWDSRDLIHWENERILDFSRFKQTENADRVWAPEIIYDPFCEQYMIYWSNHNTDDDYSTVTWCIYTEDFQSFTTEPRLLFCPRSGLAGIDADMIEKDGKYYMYIADEKKDAICYVVADRPSGPFFEPEDNRVSVAKTQVEGNCAYRILGTNRYVMIMDQFVAGGYFMQQTEDMIHFTAVDPDRFRINHLKPRHGSMLHITDAEYQHLIDAFGTED